MNRVVNMASMIKIRDFNGQERTISVLRLQQMTVEQLRVEIMKVFTAACVWSAVGTYTKDALRLIFEGKPLDNDSAPVTQYGIMQMSTVLIVKKVDGG